MTTQSHAKQELVIEAVRRNLEGDSAVEFIHQSGYAITVGGITRYLRKLGGRGKIVQLLTEGHDNSEILALLLPNADSVGTPQETSAHDERPIEMSVLSQAQEMAEKHIYDTTKISIRVPSDLYEAIRLASKAEGKTQSQLIVDILTTALASIPILTNGTGPERKSALGE